MPEMWFVLDAPKGDFQFFATETNAQTAYEKMIAGINADIGTDEYDGDEHVYMGRVHRQAEVVPVGIDEDTGDELWSLVSYGMVDK